MDIEYVGQFLIIFREHFELHEKVQGCQYFWPRLYKLTLCVSALVFSRTCMRVCVCVSVRMRVCIRVCVRVGYVCVCIHVRVLGHAERHK